MKKFFAILSFVLVTILVAGCSGDNSAQVRLASQKLSSGLDQIINLTNKLDNIDTTKMDMSDVLSNEKATLNFENNLNFKRYNNTRDKDFQKEKKVSLFDNFGKNIDFATKDASIFNFIEKTNKTSENFSIKEAPVDNFSKIDDTAPLYDKNYKNRSPINFSKNFDKDIIGSPTQQIFKRHTRCDSTPFHERVRASKLEKTNDEYSSLYTLSNNCKNLNVELVTAKANILKKCNETKANLKKLKDSKKAITESELRTLASYTDVVKDCINNVKSCKSCSGNIKNINRKKSNLATNSGAINSEFLQVYNKLDSNCCTLNNTLYCLEEINCFVKNLNGENCSTTTNVNPYIRNNRYLNANKERHRNEYNY